MVGNMFSHRWTLLNPAHWAFNSPQTLHRLSPLTRGCQKKKRKRETEDRIFFRLHADVYFPNWPRRFLPCSSVCHKLFFRPLAHGIRSCYTQQLLAAAASGVRALGGTGAGLLLLFSLRRHFIYSNKCAGTG